MMQSVKSLFSQWIS